LYMIDQGNRTAIPCTSFYLSYDQHLYSKYGGAHSSQKTFFIFILNNWVILIIVMEELLDMIIGDESPSTVSDKIKDILFDKSSEKLEVIRPSINNSLFNTELEDTEE
jgi:hypothetical protein